MSFIVKGIDLPKDIDELRLIINGMSIAIDPTEAIQIPTPHGRIVDLKDIRYCAFSSDGKTREIQFLLDTQVDALPTILEAEEEDGEV